MPLGDGGVRRTGPFPQNACELFGPDSPPPTPGQPSARPTDPDTTGGFYLPVRTRSDGGSGRPRSSASRASRAASRRRSSLAFSSGYRANTNPAVSTLSRRRRRTAAPRPSRRTRRPPAPALARLAGRAGRRCASRGRRARGTDACGGAETYLYIDPTSKQIATRRESMVASWYATAGTFDEDRSGRDETDRPPMRPTAGPRRRRRVPCHLWVVLRDARGGVGWASYTVDVEP